MSYSCEEVGQALARKKKGGVLRHTFQILKIPSPRFEKDVGMYVKTATEPVGSLSFPTIAAHSQKRFQESDKKSAAAVKGENGSFRLGSP